MILSDDLRWWQCGIGDISFQTVPYLILLDLILTDTYIVIIVKLKELAVATFINLILGDFAGSIGFS